MQVAFSRKPTAVGTIATGIMPLPADLRSAQPQALFCMIGPAEAQRLLDINTTNRRPTPTTIARYARDITHDRFDLSNDAISVFTSGTLGTGQHRCKAVIEAGKAILSLVLLGLPEESATKLDQPVARRQHQNLHIMGELTGVSVNVDPTDIAAARILVGCQQSALSTDEVRDVLDRYDEPLSFAKTHALNAKGHVRAAIAAAYMAGVDATVLQRFCAVLADGITNGPHESAAVRLREKLPTMPGSNAGRIEQRRLTMNAIKFFARGHDAKKLPVPDRDLYPLGTLPEENI